MRNQPTAWVCVFCLASVASWLAPDIARGQAAAGRATFVEYREVAPRKATRNMYIKPDGKLDEEASVIGYKSVAVPGTVAGLELALKTYGTMKLADVMGPAIRLAENGFVVNEKLARQCQEEKAGLQQAPAGRRIFLNDGKMLQAGDT